MSKEPLTNKIYALALNSLRPGAQWGLSGDTLEGLEWLDVVQKRPTDTEIEAEALRLLPDARWDNIRSRRMQRLQETDWIMASDSQASERCRAAVASYRQALRDITSSFKNPEDVVWPTPPPYEKAS